MGAPIRVMPQATLLLLVWVVPPLAPAQSAPRVDTSGLEHFWRLADHLSRGRDPADSAWEALWATPGYAKLEQRERRRGLLTTAMRLAFTPGRKASADSAVAANRWLAMVIPHLRQVAARRDTLRRIERSPGSPVMFQAAIAKAQEFLPAGTTDRLPLPEVSLIYFLDARGYDRILFDPSYLMDLHDPAFVLGHELHHYYGNQLARPRKSFGDDMIAWRLATTETEGVAGLVDKRDVPRLSRSELAARYRDPRNLQYFEDYQADYRRSNQWLAWVDDILRRSLAAPDSLLPLGGLLDTTLPDNGRIMGAWMAEIILEQLGHARLMACVADPWCFWRTYNEAARQSGKAFVLSEQATQAIAAVERRYTLPGR